MAGFRPLAAPAHSLLTESIEPFGWVAITRIGSHIPSDDFEHDHVLGPLRVRRRAFPARNRIGARRHAARKLGAVRAVNLLRYGCAIHPPGQQGAHVLRKMPGARVLLHVAEQVRDLHIGAGVGAAEHNWLYVIDGW